MIKAIEWAVESDSPMLFFCAVFGVGCTILIFITLISLLTGGWGLLLFPAIPLWYIHREYKKSQVNTSSR